MTKKFSLSTIFLFMILCSDVWSQTSYGFKDIPVIVHLDSMERVIPHLEKNSLAYIKHLIAIEHSRIEHNSYKSGKYIHEIDSLSRARSFEFGIAFVQYYKCVSISISPNKLKEIMIYGEPALKTFEKLKDSMGIFLLHVQTIKVAQDVIIFNESVKGYEFKDFYQSTHTIQKLYLDLSQKLIVSTEAFVKRQKDPYYTIVWNTAKSALKFSILNHKHDKKILDTVQLIMQENISLILKHPRYDRYLLLTYTYYANSYYLKDSLKEALRYHLLAKAAPFPDESIYSIMSYLNIINVYKEIDKEKYCDTIYKYANAALSILDRKDFTNDTKIILKYNCYNSLAIVFEVKKDYKQSIQYLRKVLINQVVYANDLLSQSVSTYFEFEKLREQTVRNKELELENKVSTQRNWFAGALLLITTLALIFILWNYKKLKVAKEKIEVLQKEREKFYTIISHDLLSPMESYQGLADTVGFLLKHKKYEDLSQIAVQIDKTGVKLKNLIGNLLAWSLEQQNLIGMQIAPIDIKDILENLTPIYQPIISKKEIIIHKNIDVDFYLETDMNLLNTILRNALDNATKFAPEKSTITIIASKLDHSNSICISNLASFSEEQFKLISELYSQDNNWHPGHQGLGLGLFLIRDFTRKLGLKTSVSYQDNMFQICLTQINL